MFFFSNTGKYFPLKGKNLYPISESVDFYPVINGYPPIFLEYFWSFFCIYLKKEPERTNL